MQWQRKSTLKHISNWRQLWKCLWEQNHLQTSKITCIGTATQLWNICQTQQKANTINETAHETYNRQCKHNFEERAWTVVQASTADEPWFDTVFLHPRMVIMINGLGWHTGCSVFGRSLPRWALPVSTPIVPACAGFWRIMCWKASLGASGKPQPKKTPNDLAS